MKTVRFYIISLLCVFCSLATKAQFSVERDLSPMEIARELVGPNLEISNIQFNGSTNVNGAEWGIGRFKEPEGRFDSIKQGIVLGTYHLQFLNLAPNSLTAIDDQDLVLGAHHTTQDADLHQMIKEPNQRYFDGAVLEFDFVSPGDSLSFNYVFGSDEYPYFVCSQYNDAFGLFLSGPGINGPYENRAVNLAEITASDLNVGINTVNNGNAGNGTSPSQARSANINVQNNCYNGDGLDQNNLFRVNGTGAAMNDMEMNGFTKNLVAAYGPLQCFQTYHLKFVIADVADHRFSSVVFLERGNFLANSKVTAEASVKVNNKGCTPFLLTTINQTRAKEHYWSFGDGFESNLLEPEHIYENPGTYEILYIARDSSKCEPVDSQKFSIEILPPKLFNPKVKVNLSKGCSTLDSLVVTMEISGGTDVCYWDMGDGSNPLEGLNIEHVYHQKGNYSITITAIDTLCGRDSSFVHQVHYTGPPMLKAEVEVKNKVLGCKTLDMGLKNHSFNSAETNHSWDFGDGGTSNEFEPDYFYKRNGKYTVTYTLNNDTFCVPADTTSFEIEVLNTELFEARVIEPHVPKCNYLDTITLNFEVKGKAFEYITWDFGDGTDKIKNKTKVTHHYNRYGPFEASVLLTDTGCSMDSLIMFKVDFKEPSRTIAKIDVKNPVIGCKPFLAEFSNESNSTNHLWDFGDGKRSSKKSPDHQYEKTGKYTITYIGINRDLCFPVDSAQLKVEVVRIKEFKAELDFTPPEPCSSTKFTLEIHPKYTGESTDSLVWDFGDGSKKIISTGKEIYETQHHTYKETGKYEVHLRAFDNLCGNKDEIKIPINYKRKPDAKEIMAPNVFSPNNDGINDFFLMFYQNNKEHNLYSDLLEYELDIFDRMGNNVYHTKMVEQIKETALWDGNTPSGMISQGVYFFVIKYRVKCINEDEHQPLSIIKGSVSVMK